MGRKLFFTGLALLLALLAGTGLWLWHRATAPVVLAAPVTVEIPAGAGAAEAARRLVDAGVIRSKMAIRIIMAVHRVDHRLQAGEYRFAGSLTPGQVLHRLVAGEVLLHAITIPEGLTLRQTADLLAAEEQLLSGDIMAAFQNAGLVRDLDPAADDLEGYLFPDTYQVARGTPARVISERMVQRFREVTTELIATARGPAQERATDMRAWVTLASLVEKETGLPEERRRVAGVFVNRLQLGMPLQCDPTVVYALQQQGIQDPGSLARWLDMDHDYNTYRHPGLPPGPIANPGRAALAAALSPAAGDDLYFVADGSGGHQFSATLAEHNRAVREWRQFQAAKKRLP